MGFNPGSTLGATDLRIGLVAVNTLLAACVGFVMAMGIDQRQVRQARHLDVVQRHARRPRRDHGAVRVRRTVGRGASSARSPACSSCTASRSSTVAHVDDPCGAISVHGVSGAWGVLAVGLFADGTYGVGLERRRRNGTTACKGCSTATAASSSRRSFHVVVGFIWAWGITWIIFTIAKHFMQIRVSPEVEIEGLDMPEFGVLALPRLRARTDARPAVTSHRHRRASPSAAPSAPDPGGPS